MFSKVYIFALLALAAVSRGENPEDRLDGVEDLTPKNFNLFVGGAKHSLVEFYAPWCGHCKHLTPEWKKLAKAVAGDAKLRSRVTIAKVNADDHREIGEAHGVQGFPTIKYFGPGSKEGENYEGPRNVAGFLEFLKEKVTDSKEFAHVESLNPLAKKFFSEKDAKKQAAIVADAEKAAGKVSEEDKDNAALYVQYMKKAIEKGSNEYLVTEKGRLERVLASGSVRGPKADEMQRKASVLSAFSE